MKNAHFDHTDRNAPIGNATINSKALPRYQGVKRIELQDSNAYRLRNQPLDLTEKGQATNYVTTNHMKVKWN